MSALALLVAVTSLWVGDPSRPQLHLTVPSGWVNDPNGLSWRAGEWHFFCQHNPYGVTWGNMSWYHLVSRDLLHWQPLGDVMTPDAFGAMFSGSAVTDVENTAGFGRGAHVLVYTAMGDQGGVQCLASSTDGRRYGKYAGNPVLRPKAKGADRDPKVFWHAPTKHWVMALYVEKDGKKYLDILNSSDLRSWELQSELPGIGESGKPGWLYECPGLEELKVEGEDATAWVVWGADAGVCQIGAFDGRIFTPLQGAPLPSGVLQPLGEQAFYAAQTFNGVPDGRVLWVPWMRLPYRGNAVFSQGFGLIQELTLRRTSGGLRLVRRPAREYAKLRDGAAVPLAAFDGELAEVSLAATLAKDGQVVFDLRGLRLAYDAASAKLTAGNRTVDWPVEKGRFAVTVFLDRGCAEIFSSDGLRMLPIPDLPSDPTKRMLSVLSSRGLANPAFSAWRLKSIWLQI